MSVQVDSTAPPSGTLSPDAARPYLTAEYGHFCFRCGLKPSDERPRMDVDHIIPVARGGQNTYLNYQYLCGPCNSWKWTQIIDFRPGDRKKIDAGLPIIPNEDRARKTPVKLLPPSVPIIPPAPRPITDDPSWQVMTPAVTELFGMALRGGSEDFIATTKSLVESSVTLEINAAIGRSPTAAAHSLLKHFILLLHNTVDYSVSLREATRVTGEVVQGWGNTMTLVDSLTKDRDDALSLQAELIQVYRQRNRRERWIVFLVFYALVITGAALGLLLR